MCRVVPARFKRVLPLVALCCCALLSLVSLYVFHKKYDLWGAGLHKQQQRAVFNKVVESILGQEYPVVDLRREYQVSMLPEPNITYRFAARVDRVIRDMARHGVWHTSTLVIPRVIVEVGSNRGNSAINIAKAIMSMDSGHDSDFVIVCVDTWSGNVNTLRPDSLRRTTGNFLMLKGNNYTSVTNADSTRSKMHKRYTRFLSNILHSGLEDKVVPVIGSSLLGLQYLTSILGSIPVDFIFLDTSHEYEMTNKEIDACFHVLRPGGFLCGHDFTPGWPGVQQAVREFVMNNWKRLEGHEVREWVTPQRGHLYQYECDMTYDQRLVTTGDRNYKSLLLCQPYTIWIIQKAY